MSYLDALISRRTTYQSALTTLKEPAQWLQDWFGARPSASGIAVTERNALWDATVFACVRIMSETIASLPLILYERLEDGSKRRAVEHDAYHLMHDEPNPLMTSMTFRQTLQGHAMTWGNGMAQIDRNRGGGVNGLMPRRPDRIEIKTEKGEVVYWWTPPEGQPIPILPENMLHVAGLGFDGLSGYGVVTLARESLGLGMAAEMYASRFFGNSAVSSGAFTFPRRLGDDAKKNLRESLKARHTGENQWQHMILEDGLTWEATGLPAKDSQMLETRTFQVREKARWFGVPLTLLEEHDKASSFASVEQFMISFAVHRVRPWAVRWEQELNRKLLAPEERGRFFFEHLLDGLLRGDLKSRYAAYEIGIKNTWLNANQIHEWENMDPMGEIGDTYWRQQTIVPAATPVTAPRESGRGQDLDAAERAPLADAFGRLLRRESLSVDRLQRKYIDKPSEFRRQLADYYRAYSSVAAELLRPALAPMVARHLVAANIDEPGIVKVDRAMAAAAEYAETVGVGFVIKLRAARLEAKNLDALDWDPDRLAAGVIADYTGESK